MSHTQVAATLVAAVMVVLAVGGAVLWKTGYLGAGLQSGHKPAHQVVVEAGIPASVTPGPSW